MNSSCEIYQLSNISICEVLELEVRVFPIRRFLLYFLFYLWKIRMVAKLPIVLNESCKTQLHQTQKSLLYIYNNRIRIDYLVHERVFVPTWISIDMDIL